MRILILTQILPYPPDAGPRVKTWHVIRYLAESGHRLILASFVREEEEAHIPALESLFEQLHTVPLRRSRLRDAWDWMVSLLSGRPFLVLRDDHPDMRKLVAGLIGSGRIDAVHVDQLSMAQFVPWRRGDPNPPDGDAVPSRANARPLVVFDAHNAVWKILDRMKGTAPMPLRPIIALEAKRMRKYEGELVRSSDFVLVVSEADRRSLLEAAASGAGIATDPGNVLTVPIAVDTDTLRPAPRPSGSFNILTLGTLHYPPNADGIRWFLREIFPLIKRQVPEATLTIVGKNPPRDLFGMAARYAGDVSITGYVPRLEPYLNRSAVLVVPVRVGGGMRVRILEALAFAIPTVTTTVGLEGIDAIPGEHVLVGDEPHVFASHVVSLLRDEFAQATLSENGRRLAEARYDRHRVLKKLDLIYGARSHALSQDAVEPSSQVSSIRSERS